MLAWVDAACSVHGGQLMGAPCCMLGQHAGCARLGAVLLRSAHSPTWLHYDPAAAAADAGLHLCAEVGSMM
jgi:hypothetical protein